MLQLVSAATRGFVCLSVLAGFVGVARAQGPTSAAIAGRIVDDRGLGVRGAEVVVTNQSTGTSMRAVSRAEGRYQIGGLEVGGPYTVTVRRIGSPVLTRSGFGLTLGQRLEVDLVLAQQAVTILGVETRAARDRVFSRAHMGTESFLSESTIRRMPVINRDLYDLVRLVPQTSTWFALAPSGAGIERALGVRIRENGRAAANPRALFFQRRIRPADRGAS